MDIYLDYNATTPVDPDVQSEICSVLKRCWGNPSSSYSIGADAKRTIESARKEIAEMISARRDEIIFTSGGTESNNMVIHSVLQDYSNERKNSSNADMDKVPHIITTNIEHDSIKLPLEILSKEGKADVTFVPVSKEDGCIKIRDVINEIRPNTRLITVMLANNETGVIQPVSLIKTFLKSLKGNSNQIVYVHTDAAQAIGKIDVDVQELDVDYLTIVGHKFYGPRIGALYFRKSCPLFPMLYGGGQENSYRPGTENTCMIAGLGKAAQLVHNNLKDYESHMIAMKNYLKNCLKSEFADKIIFNVKPFIESLPNTLSVAFNFDNFSGRMLLNEASNIYASTGAACHSGSKPSSVLIASGVSETLASKTLRLSVGRETTSEHIDIAVKYLKEAVEKLSNMQSNSK